MVSLDIVEVLGIYEDSDKNLLEFGDRRFAPCSDAIILLLQTQEEHVQIHLAESEILLPILFAYHSQHEIIYQPVLFHHGVQAQLLCHIVWLLCYCSHHRVILQIP